MPAINAPYDLVLALTFIFLAFLLFLTFMGYDSRFRLKNPNGWEAEIEIAKSKAIEEDKKSPLYRGEDIETSQIFTLKDVTVIQRENSRGETVDSTVLHFEETATVRKMDKVFDPDGLIAKRAKSLIGARVFTTAWQPEKYHPSRWWRQIYKAP